MEHRSTVRTVVVACGVPDGEVEDVTATTLLAAWTAIQDGRFQLRAGADPGNALRSWMEGIAWRLAMHERGRARHRREVLVEDPWSLAAGAGVLDPEGQFAARSSLRLVGAMSPMRQEVLLAAIEEEGVVELARQCGITPRAALQRVARARRELQAQIDVEGVEGARGEGGVAVR